MGISEASREAKWQIHLTICHKDQIKRWKDFRNRWSPKSCEALENMNPKEGTRQALLQWALDPQTPEKSAAANDKE